MIARPGIPTWRCVRSRVCCLRRATLAHELTFGGASFVTVAQAANFPECDHVAFGDALNAARRRRVFGQREMSARPVIVGKIAGQDSTQMLLAEDDHVVQARLIVPISLSTDGFCQELEGPDNTSPIPMPSTRRRNTSP